MSLPPHFSSAPPSLAFNTYISLFPWLSLFNQSLLLPPLASLFLHLTGQRAVSVSDWSLLPQEWQPEDCSQGLLSGWDSKELEVFSYFLPSSIENTNSYNYLINANALHIPFLNVSYEEVGSSCKGRVPADFPKEW